LHEISEEAVSLIKIITLELSGIRDGDGNWYGTNAVTGTGQILKGLFAELQEIYEMEYEAQRNGDDKPCATKGEAR
jgi:hypothetical protein